MTGCICKADIEETPERAEQNNLLRWEHGLEIGSLIRAAHP
jgi:hypothetical protein